MFNSQKINTDPEPWRNPNDGARRKRQVKWISGPDEFKPRPEYDNNPNLILLAFREAGEHSVSDRSLSERAKFWLGEMSGERLRALPNGMIEHARKVLQRLVALGEAK